MDLVNSNILTAQYNRSQCRSTRVEAYSMSIPGVRHIQVVGELAWNAWLLAGEVPGGHGAVLRREEIYFGRQS